MKHALAGGEAVSRSTHSPRRRLIAWFVQRRRRWLAPPQRLRKRDELHRVPVDTGRLDAARLGLCGRGCGRTPDSRRRGFRAAVVDGLPQQIALGRKNVQQRSGFDQVPVLTDGQGGEVDGGERAVGDQEHAVRALHGGGQRVPAWRNRSPAVRERCSLIFCDRPSDSNSLAIPARQARMRLSIRGADPRSMATGGSPSPRVTYAAKRSSLRSNATRALRGGRLRCTSSKPARASRRWLRKPALRSARAARPFPLLPEGVPRRAAYCSEGEGAPTGHHCLSQFRASIGESSACRSTAGDSEDRAKRPRSATASRTMLRLRMTASHAAGTTVESLVARLVNVSGHAARRNSDRIAVRSVSPRARMARVECPIRSHSSAESNASLCASAACALASHSTDRPGRSSFGRVWP